MRTSCGRELVHELEGLRRGAGGVELDVHAGAFSGGIAGSSSPASVPQRPPERVVDPAALAAYRDRATNDASERAGGDPGYSAGPRDRQGAGRGRRTK